MNSKIVIHFMPWELDFAELTFDQLAKSKKYLDKNDKIYIHTALNLSSYIINWEDSILKKDFFIERYNRLLKYLNEYDVISKIYDGNELYGHLDLQKEIIQDDIDYYISICPDMYFHTHSLHYLIQSAKNLKDRYFIITTETPKLWDYTWDVLVNKNFNSVKYIDWESQNINDIIHIIDNNDESPYLDKIIEFKYAGWFDLYNKNFYEKFMPCMPSWNGYGPWDFFGMIVSNFAKTNYKTEVNQYVLRNQIICERNLGIFQKKLSPNIYKKYLKLNDIPDQRKTFESKFQEYFLNWKDYAFKNKIL